jgi:hypothetical protein
MKGWSLRFCKLEKNIRCCESNADIYTDINKFLEYFQRKLGFVIKGHGGIKEFNKHFFMYRHPDDFDIKNIEDITRVLYIYYDKNMDEACWIEVHNVN